MSAANMQEIDQSNSAKKMIGTHSETFHADEATACFLLRQTKLFANAGVVRSRDPEVLAKMDIVVDVGGVYDHARKLYDHHQRDFNETFDSNHSTRLSSAGLIYRHYGREAIRSILKTELSDHDLEIVYHRLYDHIIEGLDGIDNGKLQYPSDLKPAYKESTSLSSRISRLNPWWNRSISDDELMTRFEQAVSMAGVEITSAVEYFAHAWLPARRIVVQAVDQRHSLHASGRICLLETSCPWTEHLRDLEAECGLDDSNNILYVLYEDNNRNWRVQAVSVYEGSFESRKALPEPWRGLRGQALTDVSNLTGAVFVHATGFIGGMQTREGALAMASAALAFP